MIDLEDITESSEFYDAAQAAKEKVDAEGSDTKKRKAVIAILVCTMHVLILSRVVFSCLNDHGVYASCSYHVSLWRYIC